MSLHASSTIRTASSSTKARDKKRKHQDPYALALARQRKAANLSRQRVLKEQRATAVGSPVIGNHTPFVDSLQDVQQQGGASTSQAQTQPDSDTKIPWPSEYLSHYVSAEEFGTALDRSRKISEPVPSTKSSAHDPQKEADAVSHHEKLHSAAEKAMRRILQLENASSKDRTHVNTQRCIDMFGRHKTDSFLEPKPTAINHPGAPQHPEPAPRAGPDTGSSEVQAAVLTTKILVLAKQLEKTGHKDKVNKRNLQLLVHRRQKLLKYLRRKERGGPRWQYLMQNLGLTDASWKGEISL